MTTKKTTSRALKVHWQTTTRPLVVSNRVGHAEAEDAEVCRLMRICGSVAEDKICMRHSRQKKQGKK